MPKYSSVLLIGIVVSLCSRQRCLLLPCTLLGWDNFEQYFLAPVPDSALGAQDGPSIQRHV
jgi:hypothetical protein